jgi:hypothetical protein
MIKFMIGGSACAFDFENENKTDPACPDFI